MFAGLEEEEDEDLEIETAMEEYRKKGGVVIGGVTVTFMSCQSIFNLLHS